MEPTIAELHETLKAVIAARSKGRKEYEAKGDADDWASRDVQDIEHDVFQEGVESALEDVCDYLTGESSARQLELDLMSGALSAEDY